MRFPTVWGGRAETRSEWQAKQVGTECHSIGGCKVAAKAEGEYTRRDSVFAATVPVARICRMTGVETLAEIIVRWYRLIINVHQAWVIAAVGHC